MATRWTAATATAATVSIASLAFTGCGGHDDAEPSISLVVCDLLDTTELDAHLGGTVDDISEGDHPSASSDTSCSYRRDEGRTHLLVQVHDGPQYHLEIDDPALSDPVEIPALGDSAHIDRGSVRVLSDDWSISVARIGGPVSDDSLVEIAEMIVARLD